MINKDIKNVTIISTYYYYRLSGECVILPDEEIHQHYAELLGEGDVMKEKVIKTNKVELYTESFGSENNPAILLVARATVSMLFWNAEFCHRLTEKGFFVIRYDNRDVEKSTLYEPGTTPCDIVNLTDDTAKNKQKDK